MQIRDGYGQTETGQLTGMPPGRPARPGSMGLPLPGMRLDVRDGELVADPATVPTFFVALPGRGRGRSARTLAHGRSRDPRRGRLPVLRGPQRRRDHLGRLPHRPVRGRVGADQPSGGGRSGGRRRAGCGARLGRARGGGPARGRVRRQRLARELQDARPQRDRPLQVPADRGVRGRAAQDRERQGTARAACGTDRTPPEAQSGSATTASISTSAPRGSAATPTVTRAGGSPSK